MRPLLHEIDNVYICGDGKRFLDEKKALAHQQKLETKEIKKLLLEEQKRLNEKIKKFNDNNK